MRPTKEMIMATEALIQQANKDIRRIIRDNDIQMKNVRKSSIRYRRRSINPWLLFLLLMSLAGLGISQYMMRIGF